MLQRVRGWGLGYTVDGGNLNGIHELYWLQKLDIEGCRTKSPKIQGPRPGPHTLDWSLTLTGEAQDERLIGE